MAVFDVVVNNADRKGGHVLPMPGGHRYGVDHGLTFHVEHKLRTVLWGWVGERLTEPTRRAACAGSPTRWTATCASSCGPGHRRARWPRPRRRLPRLLARGRFPSPPTRRARSSPGRPSDAGRRIGFAPCVPGRPPRSPDCPSPVLPSACTTPRRASLVETSPEGPARLYVCGITPYDATHMGHAATYVAFDLLNRAWRSAGHEVDLRPERHRRRRPAARAGQKVNIDWVGAGRARDAALPRRHGGAARRSRRPTTSAPSSRSRW